VSRRSQEVRLSSTSVVALVLTAVLLFIPGGLVSLAAGIRPLTAFTTAPVVGFGLVALVGRIFSATGIGWRPVTFWIATAVAVLGTLLARLVVRRTRLGARLPWSEVVEDDAPGLGKQLVGMSAAAVAGVIGVGAAVWGMGGLTAINQGFDAIFHVNAVTFIATTGSADPAGIEAINRFPYGSAFYPEAFHALAALVAQSGINSVVATNALVACVPLVLATGLTGLLWQMGLHRHAVVAPFVGISVAAFPTDIMWRGPIWPFALGVALIPAVLALLTGAFESRSRALAGAAALGTSGLLLVHPSAALAAGLFAGLFFLQRWITSPRLLRKDIVPLLVVGVAIVVLALPAVITAVSNSGLGAAYDWPAVQRAGDALGELVLFNYDAPLPQVWLFVLLVFGLVGLRRFGRMGWWLAGGAIFTVLLVLAAAYDGPWVALLTGAWWNDRFRFAALAALVLGVLCAHGVVVAAGLLTTGARWTAARLRRPVPARRSALVAWAAVLAVLALFGVLSGGFYADYNRSRMQLQYAMGTGGSVTPPELDGMAHLATLVGPGQTVMNDPNDGSAWMWALHGVRPMYGQAVLTPIKPALMPDQQTALTRFDCVDSSADVRRIIAKYDIDYVYVGQDFIIPTQSRARGLQFLAESRSLHLVYDNGGAQIYRVDLQPLVPLQQDAACLASEHSEHADE
jgi:hypothetical protein